jgi:hypothetical protein
MLSVSEKTIVSPNKHLNGDTEHTQLMNDQRGTYTIHHETLTTIAFIFQQYVTKSVSECETISEWHITGIT